MNSAECVRNLIRSNRHKEAEDLLTLLLKDSPNDADLAAQLGMLYCYTQREFEAVELLERGESTPAKSELRQALADYFHCRTLMAQKLGVDDAKGREAAKRVDTPPRSNVGIRLSACLIVKNEEAHLDRCLSSIAGLCDEIVVVDTGSTDNTVAIAEKHGATIGHFEWCDDFAAARNASLELATGDWALWIDADEELTADSWNAVREGLIRPHFGGYFLKIVNLMDESAEANQYVHAPVRLFRRTPEISFEGRIHEQVLQCFDRHGLVAATLSNVTLRHYGYQPTVMLEKDKLNRTVKMLERETRENPRDAFHWFNLANAYSVGRRVREAEIAARTCLNFIPEGAPYAPVAYQILTSSLIAQDRADEALQECHVAELKGDLSIINEFDRAHALLKLNRNEDALASIEACLAMDWPHGLTGDFAIKTYKGSVLKSQILTRLGRCEEALALADDALTQDPSFGIAHYARACALDSLGRSLDAALAYVQASKQTGLEACRTLAARAFAQAGDPAKAAIYFEALFIECPEDDDAAAGWIHALEQAGDDAGLVRAYTTLVQAGRINAPLLTNWGRALIKVGQLNDALQAFESALATDPSYANAALNAGDLLYSCGCYAEAAGHYETALRADPLNAQAWFVLGNSFARLEHSEGAQLAYRQTLSIDPHHREAQMNLGLILEAA